MSKFLDDVWRGLNSSPKYLDSKYFYDDAGDAIFREIMQCPEYYLTKCELEIFSTQSDNLSDAVLSTLNDFDVVELGAGDASKSTYLLRSLLNKKGGFTYYPIDISEGVIENLAESLANALPGIKVHGLNGEHFEMLEALKEVSRKNKIVLFLGSSVGNIPVENTVDFFKKIRSYLLPGDLMLTGFDLKKDPEIILAAYDDKEGITKRFNLNLLSRINKTLDADFDLSRFAHRPVYIEQTGTCKSYLESLVDQRVRIGVAGSVNFKAGEQMQMEMSQKYTIQQTDDIAAEAGFTPLWKYYDSRHWFLDAVWRYQI